MSGLQTVFLKQTSGRSATQRSGKQQLLKTGVHHGCRFDVPTPHYTGRPPGVGELDRWTEYAMQVTRRQLSIVEIVCVVVALVLGVLWARKPTGPYEPYAFLVSLVGTTLVEIVRRHVPDQSEPTARSTIDPLTITRPTIRTQEGTLDLNSLATRKWRVVYAEPFLSRPNLEWTVESIVGNKVAITEDDETGFTVAKPGFWTSGTANTLRWQAKGRAD